MCHSVYLSFLLLFFYYFNCITLCQQFLRWSTIAVKCLCLLSSFIRRHQNILSCCFSKTGQFNEACTTHGNLKTLAQIAFTRSWHWVHFVIEKKKAPSFFIHLLFMWKCYRFNERWKSDMWVEFINNFNGHRRDCLTPKLSVNMVLVRQHERTSKPTDPLVQLMYRNYQSTS